MFSLRKLKRSHQTHHMFTKFNDCILKKFIISELFMNLKFNSIVLNLRFS
jgi:hypothetical protein